MKYEITENSARISEVFSSLQGEGTHLGERHLFVRFEECHIHCEYCDELDKVGTVKSRSQLLAEVIQFEKNDGPHAYVSLTGGEPLLYLKFLKPFLAELKQAGFKTYLETNGILWKALSEVIHNCDCIAMDMKPASVTGEKCFDDDHLKFLEIAQTKEVFVKFVLSKKIDPNEFLEELNIIHRINPKIPVVLQPISELIEGHEDPELMSRLDELQKLGAKMVESIRIVPRFHKILKIR